MLFRRKADNETWRNLALAVCEETREVVELFERTGHAVGDRPLSGWMDVSDDLSYLGAVEKHLHNIRRRLKSAGSPTSPELRAVERLLVTFFDHSKLALHWGKHHLKDASGGPGFRAATLDGFAGKAATIRVTNNATQFAQYALSAAQAGRSALSSLQAHSAAYRTEAPPLVDLFLLASGVEEASWRRKDIPFPEMAMLSSWCFDRAAILGMVLHRDPNSALESIWDPSRASAYWELIEKDGRHRLAALRGRIPGSLGMFYLRSEWPEAYEVYPPSERLLRSKLRFDEARSVWTLATAVGFGLGVQHPDVVQGILDGAANQDPSVWRAAHDSGVAVPPVPPVRNPIHQIYDVIEVCRPFFRQYYASAFEALREAETRIE